MERAQLALQMWDSHVVMITHADKLLRWFLTFATQRSLSSWQECFLNGGNGKNVKTGIFKSVQLNRIAWRGNENNGFGRGPL